MSGGEGWATNVAYVLCPECGAVIPVTFRFRLDPQPYIVNHEATFLAHADPDLTDVWAHAWTHQEATS